MRKLILALALAGTCTAAHANTMFYSDKCTINGVRFDLCAVENSMSQGWNVINVGTPTGEHVQITNNGDVSPAEAKWFINGKVARQYGPNGLCFANRKVSLCIGE